MTPSDLDLQLDSEGSPRAPLDVITLDYFSFAEASTIADRARRSRRLTVGVLTTAPGPALEPLLEALTLTLAPPPTDDRRCVSVSDPLVAADELASAVLTNPRAAVTIGHLLRQTESATTSAGLSAEAATYSMLLGGGEFSRWLERRRPRRTLGTSHSRVAVLRADNHLTITLDRPERRNALDSRLREQLFEALDLARTDNTISTVVLIGPALRFVQEATWTSSARRQTCRPHTWFALIAHPGGSSTSYERRSACLSKARRSAPGSRWRPLLATLKLDPMPTSFSPKSVWGWCQVPAARSPSPGESVVGGPLG